MKIPALKWIGPRKAAKIPEGSVVLMRLSQGTYEVRNYFRPDWIEPKTYNTYGAEKFMLIQRPRKT